jgi:endonuclease/exonuclease/phosphatase family metal-dependent hydrolase
MILVSWNIDRRPQAWRELLKFGADVALLQEATRPPNEVASSIDVDAEPWRTESFGDARPWRTAVVRLTDRVRVAWFQPLPLKKADPENPEVMAVSRLGTLAAARVTAEDGTELVVASMYGLWENPHCSTRSNWIYADASVHRVISDLAAFIGRQSGHRVLAAGDLNILHGYGDLGSPYWRNRYETVFARMAAMGVPFVGPQAPNGRRADPWPAELPSGSMNVPTYFAAPGMTPAQAQRQLDFVFASRDLAGRVNVRALNEPENWGPSGHCRIRIEVS